MLLTKTHFFPVGATVAVQLDDDGSWMHGVIVDTNSTDHNGSSYIVRVTKKERLVTHNTKHICKTLITLEQYL